MQLAEGFAAQCCQLLQHVGVQQSEAVENTARQLGWGVRDWLVCFATGGLNLGAHMGRIDKAIVIRVDHETARWQRFGIGNQRRQVGDVLLFQYALEQPQPHDIF
ncbi:hypothetical protein D3C80_1803200 [compost metagenome]